MMMLLSHGQADIERGFSINTEVVCDNMDESTIIAYRRAYDGVRDMECEVHKIPISAKMMASCRHSRQRYGVAMEEQKKQRSTEDVDPMLQMSIIGDTQASLFFNLFNL